MLKNKRILVAVAMLLISATLLSTASYAWFAMNTRTTANGLQVGAYSDSLYLEISKDGTTYNNDISYTTAPKYLRLTTASLGVDVDYVSFSSDPVEATGTFTSGVVYYEKNGKNYVVADTEALNSAASSTADLYMNPVFERVTTDRPDTGDFYTYDSKNDIYTVETVTNPTNMIGRYKLVSANIQDSDDIYIPTSTVGNKTVNNQYYELVNNTLINVTHTLETADSVDGLGLYTINDATVVPASTLTGDGSTYYYARNINGNGDVEYTYVGIIPSNVRLDQYLFWGKAYSSSHSDVEENNTLTVVPENSYETLDDYRLATRMYIRLAKESGDATNLRIANIKVGGATNALAKALRVLVVATSSANSTNNIAYMLFDADGSVITHNNGVDDSDNLFNTVLGGEAEVITLDVYIYFDGTDAVSMNNTVSGGNLNGQTVDIEFTIDDHLYNK